MVARCRVQGTGYRVQGAVSKKCRILKQVIPTNEVRRELIVNDDNQRFGILVISMIIVRSLTLDWQGVEYSSAGCQPAVITLRNTLVKPGC